MAKSVDAGLTCRRPKSKRSTACQNRVDGTRDKRVAGDARMTDRRQDRTGPDLGGPTEKGRNPTDRTCSPLSALRTAAVVRPPRDFIRRVARPDGGPEKADRKVCNWTAARTIKPSETKTTRTEPKNARCP